LYEKSYNIGYVLSTLFLLQKLEYYGLMLVKIFTKDDFAETRDAKELGARLEADGFEVEYLDADDQHITDQIDIYDVYSYPTFLLVEEDGFQIECWRGQTPLESDIKLFLNQ
jgi:hypothetical protein